MLLLLLCACPTTKDDTADSAVDTSGALPGPSGPTVVENDCAPDDGSAVTFTIGVDGSTCSASSAGLPHARITIYQGMPLAAGDYTFGDSGDGGAWFSEDGTMEVAVSQGTLTVDSWGSTITGSYELTVQGGETYAGTFDGIECTVKILCG